MSSDQKTISVCPNCKASIMRERPITDKERLALVIYDNAGPAALVVKLGRQWSTCGLINCPTMFPTKRAAVEWVTRHIELITGD